MFERLRVELATYGVRHPERVQVVDCFTDFLRQEPRCFERSLATGHFTASAWLLDAQRRRVLLTHHRKLNRWLQLGGHADGDPDLAAVALREAGEESGLSNLMLVPGIFDLDRHRIPARAGEPAHWHYDVRYVVLACGGTTFRIGPESFDLRWWPLLEVLTGAEFDDSLRRMAAHSLEPR